MHPTHRAALVATALVLLTSFAVGVAGWPGELVVAAVDWAVDHGYLAVEGTIGEAARDRLGRA